jgi:hypothetical protein
MRSISTSAPRPSSSVSSSQCHPPPPTQLPSLVTPGAVGVLNSVKQSTSHNNYKRFLNLYSIASALSKTNKLSSEQINKSQNNFNLLKFEETDEAVHFKVLGRSFYHQKIFKSLEASIQFLETIFNSSKYISFQELFAASKSTDPAVQDTIIFYLKELAKDKENLFPAATGGGGAGGGGGGGGGKRGSSSSSTGTTEEENKQKLFAQTLVGEKSYRLTLIPRQRQNVIPEKTAEEGRGKARGGRGDRRGGEEEAEEDSVSIDLKNYSLRKSLAKQKKEGGSVSVMMRAGEEAGQEDEHSGYSYRHSRVKCGSVTIIKHAAT